MARVSSALCWIPAGFSGTSAYAHYLRERRRYRKLPGAEPLTGATTTRSFGTARNPLHTTVTTFTQDVWAARRMAELAPPEHVDVGSRAHLIGFLPALTSVVFVDTRRIDANVEGLTGVAGSGLDLPFADRSMKSLSSLHVAEHIGLGRYGDPFDPAGTREAARELARVLVPGGQLLFSIPVGRERVEFNAHRILSPASALALFEGLDLVEFSGVDDVGAFARDRQLAELADASYACGMFRFGRSG